MPTKQYTLDPDGGNRLTMSCGIGILGLIFALSASACTKSASEGHEEDMATSILDDGGIVSDGATIGDASDIDGLVTDASHPGDASSLFHTLSLVAGHTGGAIGSADGVGRFASFDNPYGTVYDGTGHVFVADKDNCTIRQVDVASGAVTTIAGRVQQCFDLDGTGTDATFARPWGLAYEQGTLYVTDFTGSTIRKLVVATGAVTTIAGTTMQQGTTDGIGAAARFKAPTDLVADGAGNLYIEDSNNYCIRKLVLATGAVTTIAGNPGVSGKQDGTGKGALFFYLQGLAYDGSGALYVSDVSNAVIRKVVVATGVVTTLPVTLTGPGALVVASAGTLVVGDDGALRTIDLASNQLTTLAGSPGMYGYTDGTGTAARFNSVTGLTHDAAGNVYAADSGTYMLIRKVVLSSGTVTTLAGSVGPLSGDGTGMGASFDGAAGISLDGAGNLWVADVGNKALRKIVVATGVVTSIGGLAGPVGVASDGAGSIYFTDSSEVKKLDVATSAVSVVAGSSTYGNADGVGTAATFGAPLGIASDGAGHLYITDNDTIRRLTVATGAVETLAGKPGTSGAIDGPGTTARFDDPCGIAADASGAVYIADRVNHTIRKLVAATGVVSTLAGTGTKPGSADGQGAAARFDLPSDVALDGHGNLYVTDSVNGTVRQIVLATGEVSTVVGVPGLRGYALGPIASARLTAPNRLVSSSGALFITDTDWVLELK